MINLLKFAKNHPQYGAQIAAFEKMFSNKKLAQEDKENIDEGIAKLVNDVETLKAELKELKEMTMDLMFELARKGAGLK